MARYDKVAHKMMFTEGEFQQMGASEATIEEMLECFDKEGGSGSPRELYDWYDDLRRSV